MMVRSVSLIVAVAVACIAAACGRITVNTSAVDPTSVDVSPLWEPPTDIAARDLFHGPGGAALLPDVSSAFEMITRDRSGYSVGYDVRDGRGQRWSVKLGPEAQSEVAVSRLLWAIGFHQPATYFVQQWQMIGADGARQGAARFRPEIEGWKTIGEWSWYENDFVNTAGFRLLLVANVLLNNWDWKTSNNRIYEVEGRHLYVVRDLGASLGRTAYPRLLAWIPTQAIAQGSRNDLEGFERQGFIRQVSDLGIEFDYGGIHGELLELIRVEDVVRTCELFAQLSEVQLDDAFRAAGYAPEVRARYMAKIKLKVAEGLKLAERRGA